MPLRELQKCLKKKFSEWGWPGVEIVPTPCGSLFNIFRPSKLPYNATSKKTWKSRKLIILYNSPIFPVWIRVLLFYAYFPPCGAAGEHLLVEFGSVSVSVWRSHKPHRPVWLWRNHTGLCGVATQACVVWRSYTVCIHDTQCVHGAQCVYTI